MNMMKKMVLGAVVLPLSFASASAFAFGGGHHEGGMKGEGMHGGKCMMKANKKAFKDLDLTDEQKAKFEKKCVTSVKLNIKRKEVSIVNQLLK